VELTVNVTRANDIKSPDTLVEKVMREEMTSESYV